MVSGILTGAWMMISNYYAIVMPARRFYWMIGVLMVAAWGLLALWQRSAYAELLGHEMLGDHHISFTLKLAAFLAGWFLMILAMMLPVSLPGLIQAARPARRASYLPAVILGYLLPWMLFGMLAFLGDSILHTFTGEGAPLAFLSPWIAPSIVLAAGLYQFAPIKQHFTRLCRPAHVMPGRGIESLPKALGEGVKSGLACIASCWALMLLMFALGHHNLGLMFVLSLVFAGERLTPWGQRISWLVGSVLLMVVLIWLLNGAGLQADIVTNPAPGLEPADHAHPGH